MQNLVTQIQHLPWDVIGQLLAASGIATALTQYAKKKLSLVNKKVISSVLLSFSFIPVALTYIFTQASQNPSYLGSKALLVAGFASQVLYPFVVRPLSNLLKDAQNERARRDRLQKADAEIEDAPVIPAELTQPALSEFSA